MRSLTRRSLSRAVAVVAMLLLALPTIPAGAAQYHIINGQPADPGEYPAQAAIIFTDQQFQFCGGTLIDPGWVLTAAHCFADGPPAEDTEVVLNTTNWTQGGERIAVSAVSIHPDYDPFLTVNDIALLQLTAPATTPPAAVVERGQVEAYTAGRLAVTTGYGTTTPDGQNPSEDLLEVELPLVSDADCANAYDLVPAAHVCAGDPGTESDPGPDSCQGDSGGPLWTDLGDGVLRQIGITSFGGLCGVERPGVYTELINYLDWVDGTIDGSIPVTPPEDGQGPSNPPVQQGGASTPPERVTFDASGVSEPQNQAVAVSRALFDDDSAAFAVLATSGNFADALGGSSLAFGIGPLLFTDPTGALGPQTLAELQRTVPRGERVFLLGGVAAIPQSTEDTLRDAGFEVIRLAGPTREHTAVAVANAVGQVLGIPADTVVLATAGNWPDAVAVGQLGSRFGLPILLTPVASLGESAGQFLLAERPSRVLVVGGTAVISEDVVSQVEAITGPGTTVRLAGDSRFGTAAAVTTHTIEEFYRSSPRAVVAVNLRREVDAYAHVLAASMLTGALGAVMVPVEGDGGTVTPQEPLDAICGLDARVIVVGDVDLVADGVLPALQGASAANGCDSLGHLQLGDAVFGSVTSVLPTRSYEFTGTTGKQVRIRLDATGQGPARLDPVLRLLGPDGAEVAFNDDNLAEPGLNSFVEATLPSDGQYQVLAAGFGGASGSFRLSLDPAAAFTTTGTVRDGDTAASYTVTGPAGSRVIVEMRTLDGGIDPLVAVIGPDGSVVAGDDDGGGFPNSRADFRMPAGGQVTILPTTFEGEGSGDFSLSVFDVSGVLSFG